MTDPVISLATVDMNIIPILASSCDIKTNEKLIAKTIKIYI